MALDHVLDPRFSTIRARWDGPGWRPPRLPNLDPLRDDAPRTFTGNGIEICSCTAAPLCVFCSLCGVIVLRRAQIIATLGVTYAAVPLYRMFCAATGFAGTPNVGTGRFEAERLVPVEGAHRIKVHFNADRAESLPWTFTPQQRFVTVLPGETSLAFYTAKNKSDQDIIGIATYNVTPDRVRLLVSVKGASYVLLFRSPRISPRSSASASRNRNFWPGKRSICLFCSLSTRTSSTTRHVGTLMMLFCLTHFSGESGLFKYN